MKLFISWSGNFSQQIAQELRLWLPLILPAVKPFITTNDIDKGARWQGEISKELEASNFGIVCLTRQNLQSQWLAFEAGALSKQLEGRVANMLFGIGHAEVQPPLSMFQGTLFDEQDVRQLVLSMNSATPLEARRETAQVEELFGLLWPRLRDPVHLIIENAAQPANEQLETPFKMEEVANEILALLRQQSKVLSSPERFLSPVLELFSESPAQLPKLSLSTSQQADIADWVRVRKRSRPSPNQNTDRLSAKDGDDGDNAA